jgi:heptosyltransferase-2
VSSRRVLVLLKPQYLGDAVMALPAIDALIAAGWRPAIRAMPHVLELFADRREQVDLLHGGKVSRPIEVLRASGDLKQGQFAAALILDRSFRSALSAALARIPVRIGHSTEGRSWLLTGTKPYSETAPETECFLELAELLGAKPLAEDPRLRLIENEKEKGSALIGGATIGLQPGARYASKRFPLSKLALVVDSLAKDGHKFALFGGTDERSTANEFKSLLPNLPFVDLVGSGSLRESMSAAGALRLMIGSDTGWMHIVAALGVPTVTIFGPNPSSKWGHRYAPHHVIQAPHNDLSMLGEEAVLAAAKAALKTTAGP